MWRPSSMARPGYRASEHAAEPGSLRDKLTWLRRHADGRDPDPRLLQWGRAHLDLGADAAAPWARRAWWGIAAGELVRLALQDCDRRDEALALIRAPDWSPVTQAQRDGGVILAAAHLGPPKFLMNALIAHGGRPLVLTNTADMPDWWRNLPALLCNPLTKADRPRIMVQAALHLRAGGVLFGAPDGGFSAAHVTISAFRRDWRFATGLPALAQMLGVDALNAFALWDGEEVVLRFVPITLPTSDLAGSAWQQAWIAAHWAAIEPIIRISPENLRFLSSGFRRELGT